MRTQATRHSDCTTHLHCPKRSALLDPHGDRASRSAPYSPLPTVGGGEWGVRGGCRRFPGVVRSTSNRTAPPSCDAPPVRSPSTTKAAFDSRASRVESHRGRLGEHRRAVEHDEGEGAAAQQDVGAPRRTPRVARADHPHPLGVAQVHPVARVERALGVHVGHPAVRGHGGLDDGAREGGLPAPRRARRSRSAARAAARPPPAPRPAPRPRWGGQGWAGAAEGGA